ncbi:MAG: uracil-DNA glycosylase [Cardiobacteriales bacterium]|nr:MAG: uracil-DNA glycosylase [Cardiobacteriales bacterium]
MPTTDKKLLSINPAAVKLEPSWKAVLINEFSQPYFVQIKTILKTAQQQGIKTYPPNKLLFNAFSQTPFNKVKIVIIGQDPYHQPQQAMGLSFSVPKGIRIPPSLINIYKELARSIEGFIPPNHGDLSAWAQQGVLLLNASLSVEHGKAGSHSKIGWQYFTNAVIKILSEKKSGLIFMLWGNFAKQKASLIDANKHYILTAVHPSPLAGGKFYGCGHFARANDILIANKQTPINWQL